MLSDAVLSRWLPPRSVLLWGDVVRVVLWAGVALAWVLFVPVYVRLWRLTLLDPANSDFTIFYYTARMLADGLPMYGASPSRYGVEWPIGHLANLNPPHFQLLIQPLALLSYDQAFRVWTMVNLAALATAVAVMVRAMRLTLTWRRALAAGALLIGAAPFTTVAITSELTFLLMVPFTCAWAAAARGRWAAAGAWLGACASLKLFFLLFVPWLLVRRRWQALAAAAVSAGVLVGLGLTAYGSGTYRLWIEGLGTVVWPWMPANASWHGLVSRALSGEGTLSAVWLAPALVGPLAMAGFVFVAVSTLWAAWHLDERQATHAAILVLLFGAILASPLGWVYYMPLALGPAVGLLVTGQWRAASRRWRWAAACALIALYVPLEVTSAGQPFAVATLTLASSYFWSLATLWMALVRSAHSETST